MSLVKKCLSTVFPNEPVPPVIGDNVVINPYTCICGNVKIGDNSVIGVGSLVLHDVPPNTVFYNVRQDFSHPRDENMVL